MVEQGRGITALNLADSGNGCISVRSRKTVVDEPSLNHGIELSPDGSIVYGSSGDTLFSWDYSSTSQSNTSAPRPLVTGMAGSDHTSRTLLLSRKVPGMMLVNHGSDSNLDDVASDITSGHAQIRAFNLTNLTQAYDYNTQGLRLGWGLRNDVGIDEHPVTGGLYSVENGADDLTRYGQDIHQNNPAEEMNFLGYLNGTQSANQGRNFGYPQCFTAWNASALPQFSGTTGTPFAIGTPNATLNDTTCSEARQAPRLSFQAHMAPLDILFNEAGTAAWVTFHGSWNRNPPIGYKLSVVEFANGEPVASSNSTTAAIDIVSNRDLTACPDGCFRPVGLAFDKQGRLFMSSDSTGEIYVVLRADGTATSAVGSNTTSALPTPATSSPAPTGTSGATSRSVGALAVMFAAVAFLLQ